MHIDIVTDEEMLDRYVLRIPILRRADTGAELGWLFDAAVVKHFMA